MLIATIRSLEMSRDHGDEIFSETGFFEHQFHLDVRLINASPEPRAFILHSIAMEVAGLVEAHKLPLFLWYAIIDARVQAWTNLPKRVDFK